MNEKAFNYQLEILKEELRMINAAIRKLDDVTQNIKKLTVTIWIGGMYIGLILDQGLRDQVWFVLVIPLFFWPIDAYYRHTQRTFIYRVNQIRDFLNSVVFADCFHNNQFPAEFVVFDPKARKSAHRKDFKDFSGFWKALFFRSVMWLYVSLMVISVLVFGLLKISR